MIVIIVAWLVMLLKWNLRRFKVVRCICGHHQVEWRGWKFLPLTLKEKMSVKHVVGPISSCQYCAQEQREQAEKRERKL